MTTQDTLCRCIGRVTLIMAVALIYGSWIPFDYSPAFLDDVPGHMQRFLGFEQPTLADAVTNIVIYIPFGLLIAARQILLGRGLLSVILWPVLCTAGIGAVAETGQLFSASRVASITDFALNLGGAALGLALARPLLGVTRRTLERLRTQLAAHPAGALLWIAVALVVVVKLAPFDLTMSVDQFRASVSEARWLPGDPTPVTAAAMNDELAATAGSFFAFALLGLLAALLIHSAETAGTSAMNAVGRLMYVAIGLELAQLAIRSHTCDIADVVTYLGGAALGAFLGATVVARAWLRPLQNRNGNAAGRMLLAMAAMVQIGIIFLAAMPADGQWVAPCSDSIVWLPFHGQFTKPFGLACGQMMSSFLWYVTLAGLAAVMVPSNNRSYTLVMCCFLTVGVVTITEITQAFTISRYADTTEPVLAFIAAVAAASVYHWIRQTMNGEARSSVPSLRQRLFGGLSGYGAERARV